MPAPEGFVIPTIGLESGSLGVLRAVTGSVGTQSVKFYIHKVYNPKKSKELGREYYDEHEMADFKNDPYSTASIRVSDLSDKQKFETAQLYERFKSQSQSGETSIAEWPAVNESDKIRLAMLGIHTVEQLRAFENNQQIFRLGPGAKELVEAAKRHCIAKYGETSTDEDRKERQLILEENKALREQSKQREEEYFQLMQRMAELEQALNAKGHKPKKKEVEAAAA